MRMYNFFRKMLICTVVASICPSFAFSAETCPSGYISVVSDATLSDDAIIVTDGDTCPSGYTSVGGDIKDVVNCISDTTVTASVCTFYDETYSVTYDCNGGTGSATGYATYNSVFTPRTDVCTRDGYSFNGYTIDGNTVPESFTWTYPGPRTLVAQWEKIVCADGLMLVNGTCVEPEFTITTTEMSADTTFSFKMSASGVFYVDFDDGNGVQKIDRTNNTSNTTYTSAAYSTAGTHTIKMYGDATGYTTSSKVAAISFSGNTKIKTVDGSLGAIFGGNTPYMFYSTFQGCRSLESIPADLFSGVTGSSEYMFSSTFSYCTSLQSIPADLFSGVTGSGERMFYSTFSNCTSLQSIPEGLFSGVEGSSKSMFYSTFSKCTSLRSIPVGLFSGVTDSGEYMFSYTFSGCTSLESIPADLFSGVTGSSEYMFLYTFMDCTSLASLPDGLFKNIEGKPADRMFYGTFVGCTKLSGYIPADTFAKMDSTDFNSETMGSIFANTALDTSCPAGTHQYITGFESAWSGKVACETISCTDDEMLVDGECVAPEFTITTTEMSAGATFSFNMSASGVFYVDFDDGNGVQKIDRTNNTSNTTYTSAAYSTAGTHIIKMYGDATGYNTSSDYAAISFSGNTNIKTVDGSLGAIFGGKSVFYATFQDCTSLESIPAGLFSGVTGSSEYMFISTFSGCTSLRSIPSGLFSGVTGSANSMFYYTFANCTSLQSIPADLFSGVTGSSEYMFYNTFQGCRSLESIPADLFSSVTGSANSMFLSTFENCTSLTSLPDGLFKNIEGKPADSMFKYTFYACTNLSGYIPADTFAKMNSTDFDSATMTDIFYNTALATTCPAGTYQYITGFESAWDSKVACVPCPDGYTSDDGAVTEDQCYKTCEKQCVQQLCPEHSVNCSTQTESITGTEYYGGTCNAQETVCSIEFDCEVGYDKLSFADTLVRNMDLIYDAAETLDECALDGSGNACDVLPAGQYAIGFDNTNGSPLQHTLFATTCNDVIGDDTDSGLRVNQGADFVQETSGAYCWERVLTLNGSPVSSSWIYNSEYESATDCAAYCGNNKPTDVAYALAMATNTNLCSPHVYTVTYDCNGGTGDTTDSATYTAIFTPRTDVCAKANYKFVGWAIDDTPVGDEFAWNYTADKKLVAQWEKIVCADGLMLANGECVEPEVVITTTEMQPMDTFIFYINSDGEFYVDWGDGNAEHITSRGQLAHTYSEAGVYNIGLYGQATGYYFTQNTDYSIGFMSNKFVKKVTGSFGDIFGVLPDGTNPSFTFTFTNCTNLEEVSEDLFSGLTGGREKMFYQTFTVTPSLKEIPAGLFSSITTGAPGMFNVAFASSGLTSLPDGLFANIQGKPATEMFASTFAASENLTGYIPADMFASLSSEDFDASTMSHIFGGTNLGTTCPAGTVQYITGFESAWDGKVACVPCPDGVCSITTPCSSEVGTGERTCYFDANTGDYTNCDETCTYILCNGGYYMNGISCTPCPDGLTSAIGATSIDECGAVRTLHIGDNDTMQLFSIRPSSSPVMVFEIDGQYKYFGQMSDIPKTISSDSDKHFIIKYNDTEYYLHDYTVE